MIKVINRQEFMSLARVFDLKKHNSENLLKYNYGMSEEEQQNAFRAYFEEFLYLQSCMRLAGCHVCTVRLSLQQMNLAKWINTPRKTSYVQTYGNFQVMYNKLDGRYYQSTEHGMTYFNAQAFLNDIKDALNDIDAAFIEGRSYENNRIVTLLNDAWNCKFSTYEFWWRYEEFCTAVKYFQDDINNTEHEDYEEDDEDYEEDDE